MAEIREVQIILNFGLRRREVFAILRAHSRRWAQRMSHKGGTMIMMVALRWATVAVVGRLSDFVRFGKLLMPSGDGRPATVRRRWRSVVAGTVMDAVLASGVCAAGAFCADGPAFAFRPLLAGRASLTESGFVETRALGTASFAPELFSGRRPGASALSSFQRSRSHPRTP